MKGDAYILQCRENWFLKIFPSETNSKEKKEYQLLIEIARHYFEKNMYNEFAGFFMEETYLIPLWTAHLMLEYGTPSPELREKSLQIIREYSNNHLAPDVAIQETNWLIKNSHQ